MTMHQLDAQRLLCPMPVIRAQDRIKELQVGDLLQVICTDPGTLHDIPAWCRVHGHEVVESTEQDNQYIFVIRVCDN